VRVSRLAWWSPAASGSRLEGYEDVHEYGLITAISGSGSSGGDGGGSGSSSSI